MKGVLPRVLYEREKFAFMAPPAHTDKRKAARLKEIVDDHMSREQVEELGLFDPDAVAAVVNRYWVEEDPVQAKRGDIVLNHLLGLHLIHQQLIQT